MQRLRTLFKRVMWGVSVLVAACFLLALIKPIREKANEPEVCEFTRRVDGSCPQVVILPTQPIPEPRRLDGTPAYRDPSIPELVKREPPPTPVVVAPRLVIRPTAPLPPTQDLDTAKRRQPMLYGPPRI